MVNSGCLEGENEREKGRKEGKCINLRRVRSESSWGQQQTKHLATPSFDLAKWHVCKLSNGAAGSVQHKRQQIPYSTPPPPLHSSPACNSAEALSYSWSANWQKRKQRKCCKRNECTRLERRRRGEKKEVEESRDEGSMVWGVCGVSVDSRLQRFVWQAGKARQAEETRQGERCLVWNMRK